MNTPIAIVICLATGLAWAGEVSAQAPDPAGLYAERCAQCHDGGADRAPTRDVLQSMSADRVLAAMETGPMISMATGASAADRRALAEYLSGGSLGSPLRIEPSPEAMCAPGRDDFADPLAGPQWNGWGVGTANARFQTGEMAGLTAGDVPRLRLKWAFGFPGDLQSNGQATVVGGRVFVGSVRGLVYALSAETGCVHWYFDAGASVRSAITVAPLDGNSGGSRRYAAWFGDARANMYALDAATGELVWKTQIDESAVARVTGSPVVHDGRVYVGVASSEEGAGANSSYECCRFRGSVVALDASTGRRIWKTYTIEEEPRPTTTNAIGVQLWGPSGASVWTTPAIDEARNALYIGTGNAYTDPVTDRSDAFIAMDLDTGRVLWSRQMTASDAYTSACRLPDKTNCAESNGPDFDFSASPILVTLADGRRLLVAGQKSGIVHAIDPDRDGEVIWQARVGQGGTMGGVQWGSATDGTNVYVAVSDIGRIMLTYSNFTDADPERGGGMFALSLENGERVWYTPPGRCEGRPRCSPAQSAAVSAFPGVAFSGSVDGHMRAYSTDDGRILWDFDTIREYETVNGVPGRGGSLDGPGAAIAGGMVFFDSGYHTAGGMPGNVLLAFSVDGE